MVLCSVDDVRAYYSPVTLTDQDILSIITVVTREILAKADSADETDKYLELAGIHLSVATTMKRARSKGELASSISTPEYSQQNTGLIDEINTHESEAEVYIQKYITIANSAYSIVSGRMGFGTVNSELF